MLTIALGIEKFLFNKQQIVNAVVVVVVYKMKTCFCACVYGCVGAYAYIHLQITRRGVKARKTTQNNAATTTATQRVIGLVS